MPPLLPPDDSLCALQPSVPHLTRSTLHRCLLRHGIPRLPEGDSDQPKRQRFRRSPTGFFHINIAEMQTAREFPEQVLAAVPCRFHTILTDNGIHFADQPRNRNTATSRQMRSHMICEVVPWLVTPPVRETVARRY